MNEFRFANPSWIHGLWAVALVAGVLVLLELRGRSVLERFVSRLMQPRLVRRTSLPRRLSALGCVILAMVALVFALMRPQWGLRAQRVVRVDSQIMICLDVSKSMLAEDVAPNRLERAKIELDSLLGLMNEGQQVGLIAFAGKATVVCPMTTDFGFLRLVLNEVEPSSVGLGGTLIGDAIRKAVDGFRESGDIHRLIMLVTDGEDHDSYPLEAAKAAKEKGVKIVTVGFGDEAGSKIEVVDPRTGARSFVKDREGRDVISHLDGETLREIALQTDGAYIPAGTGALDLESIYQTHIAAMLQGSTESQTQVLRQEAYQWLVLGALVVWLIGLALATPWNLRSGALGTAASVVANASRAAALLAGWAVASAASSGQAQAPAPNLPTGASSPPAATGARPADVPPPVDAAEATAEQIGDAQAAGEKEDGRTAAAAEEDLAPRAAYNRALALLTSNPAEAERYLNRARRDAGTDGELRYRALYNLGWVEVVRADALLKDQPAQALQHLQQAANRFREALRVRPNGAEPRHNLEIVSRRILELADALAQKGARDVAGRLDELIQELRAHQAELQTVVQQAGPEVAEASAETFRPEFRKLGVNQREVIAEIQRFSEQVRRELDALNQKPDDQKSPQDGLKAGQYGNMLQFLDDALQRLGQSRSLTRRLQGDRAFRRWSAGLADAKRARDQLRDPVELLSQILSDAYELLNLTGQLAEHGSTPSPDQPSQPAPAWLTREYIQEVQASTLDRTRELEQVLTAAAPRKKTFGPELTPSPDSGPPTPDMDPRTQQLIDNIPHALPLINQAVAAYEASARELATGTLQAAQVKQAEAMAALADAAEWFFDIRRMIEAMYADQQSAAQMIDAAQPDLDRLRDAFGPAAGPELGPQDIPRLLHRIATAVAPLQEKNRDRVPRLDQMLDSEIAQLQKSAPPSPDTPAAAPAGPSEQQEQQQQQQAQLQRFEQAKVLLGSVSSALDRAIPPLQALAAEAPPAEPGEPAAEPDAELPPRDPRWSEAEAAADSAAESLAQLRRLFFSLVEHLRDTAQRQADLNDDTARQSAEPADSQTSEKLGPLASRQAQLQPITQAIGEALREQSQQARAVPDAAQDPAGTVAPATTSPSPAAKTLDQAADLVTAAHAAMSTAARQLDRQAAQFDAAAEPFQEITQQQQTALQKLVEALALLDQSQQPPPQQQQQQDQNQQQQQQQDSHDQQSQDQQQQQNMSVNQLLQLIRDREAQRREKKQQRAQVPSGRVEKDW